jgi:hypothetical protein
VGEGKCNRPSESAGRTGDNSRFAVEFHYIV